MKETHQETFTDTEGKSLKVVVRPSLLLKNGVDEEVDIKTLSMLSSTMASKGKKVKLPALVVHG